MKLGSEVMDVITGFTGIAVQSLVRFNGNVQYGIQPKMKPTDDGYPAAMFIDEHSVVVIGDGVSETAVDIPHTLIEVGMKVRDKVTGFEGIATSQVNYINGCISFYVEGPYDPIEKKESADYYDHTRLEAVSEGMARPDVPDLPTGLKPGGAPTKMFKSR